MNIIIKESIDTNVYRELRSLLIDFDSTQEQLELALSKSLYQISIYDNDKPIAMGRLLGDGVYYYMISEVVVIEEYRNKKIGTMVLNKLLEYISNNSSKDTCIYLMSAKNKEEFYKKFGFISRPNEKYGPGMILFLK